MQTNSIYIKQTLALGRRALFNSIKQMIFFKKREMSVNKQKFIHECRV